MIDLHSHFLPGVDDGADSLATTREMLEQAAAQGITRLLATPHVNEHTTPEEEQKIRETFDLVRNEIGKHGYPLRIELSAEIRFDPAVFSLIGHDWIPFGGGKKYVVLELPIQGLPLKIREHIFDIRLKGITPVIAHPERNIVFQNQKEKLFEQLDSDTVIQVNAGSVIGQFGPGARQLAFTLLRRRQVHLICSDAHEPQRRNYTVLKRACDEIGREFGFSAAQLLCRENPRRILDGGELLTAQPAGDEKKFRSVIKKMLSLGK